MTKNGFTLIELLVVIAIIAVLAIVVILALNPAALLQQSRDANRLSDLATISSAFNLYTVDQGTSLGTASTSYISVYDPSATSTAGDQCQGLSLVSVASSASYECAASSSYKGVSGAGWIPVNLNAISTKSPLGVLPVDPINQTSSGLYYTYSTSGGQYEVTAEMESAKYKAQLSSNPMMPNYPELAIEGNNLSASPMFNTVGLVRYWPMDEGAGTVVHDYSGNGDAGYNQYGLGWTSAGKILGALGIGNGSMNYTNTSSLPTVQMTISVWTNVTQWSGSMGFLDTTGSGAGNWSLTMAYNGYPGFNIVNGSSVTISSNCSKVSPLGSWHLITGTYDGSTMTIYLDGVACGTASLASQALLTTSVLQSVAYGGGAYTFDDMRVYNRALSAAEVMALYNTQK